MRGRGKYHQTSPSPPYTQPAPPCSMPLLRVPPEQVFQRMKIYWNVDKVIKVELSTGRKNWIQAMEPFFNKKNKGGLFPLSDGIVLFTTGSLVHVNLCYTWGEAQYVSSLFLKPLGPHNTFHSVSYCWDLSPSSSNTEPWPGRSCGKKFPSRGTGDSSMCIVQPNCTERMCLD